jgi:hypothetical protein
LPQTFKRNLEGVRNPIRRVNFPLQEVIPCQEYQGTAWGGYRGCQLSSARPRLLDTIDPESGRDNLLAGDEIKDEDSFAAGQEKEVAMG